LRGLKENVIIGRLIPAGTGFNAYEDLGNPDVDLSYEGLGVFDDDADLRDVVLDDRTARSYGLDSLEDRPSFGFEYGMTGSKNDYISPILDDGDDFISDDMDDDGDDDDDDDFE
jgi:DNA-directed RNA polymerase subunit beta'